MTPRGLRIALHTGVALVVPLGIAVGWDATRWTLTAAVPAALVFEQLRLRTSLGPSLARLLPVFRPHETRRMSGAFWLLVGLAVAAWFPLPAAAVGMLAGTLADPLASAVGTHWGGGERGRRQKTVVGSTTCLVAVALIVLLAGASLVPAFMIGVVGAGLERWSGPFDDNILLAPGVTAAFWAWS